MTRNVIQNAGQSYNGVRSTTPPQLVQVNRDPGVQDSKGFIRGTFWLNTVSGNLWRLKGFTPVENMPGFLDANWVLVGGAAGDVTTLHTDDGNNVTATMGVINLAGAHGLNTTGTNGPNTATVAINNTITLGDLAVVPANTPALSMTTGDIEFFGSVLSAATNQKIRFPSNGDPNIISFLFNNVLIGSGAGNDTMTAGVANFNVGIGIGALHSLTDGAGNTALGASLAACTTGNNNLGNGNGCLTSLTTGSDNTALGNGVMPNLITGAANIGIGDQCGVNYTGAESDNILIGAGLPGTTGESNVIRIATQNAGKAFIGNIRGVTTDINDAVPVLIDSLGQLGTTSSSIKYKQNIRPMESESEVIYQLNPVIFNYRKYPEQDSWGLIAEDVEKVFPQLVVYKENDPETVKYLDLIPLLLNEVIKLQKRIVELEKK